MRRELLLARIWARRGAAARLLLPLASLYHAVVAARRACYRTGLCRVERFSAPVVVVGGLTVGGSGKTPLVMHVATLLARRGFRPGIVSRGYGGRPPRQPLRVDAATPVAQCGDEPAMLARELSLPVVVDRNRPRGVRELFERLGCDVVVADDGLQHYTMGRQVEIAVLGGERPLGNGYLLPAGPLREPPSRLAEVDLVVCNGGAEYPGGHAMRLRSDTLRALAGGATRPLAGLRGVRVHAVAATGNPTAFFTMLAGQGLRVTPHPFPDHYRFRRGDFMAMRDAPIVMTQKDAVKCDDMALGDAWFTHAVAELDEKFDNQLVALLKS